MTKDGIRRDGVQHLYREEQHHNFPNRCSPIVDNETDDETDDENDDKDDDDDEEVEKE